MRGGQAWHCVFLPVSAILDILTKIFKRLSKNLQKPGKLWFVTDFMLQYGSLEIPSVTQAFVLWCRSLRSLFHAYALLQSQYYGICVAQPKIARIISIVSGVLWWQYATYAFSCIMTKASSGYHMRCTHFVHHILEGVWLLHCLRLTEVRSAQGGQESALELMLPTAYIDAHTTKFYFCKLFSCGPNFSESRNFWEDSKMVVLQETYIALGRWLACCFCFVASASYHQADVAKVDNQTGLASGSSLTRVRQEIAFGVYGTAVPTPLQVALRGPCGAFSLLMISV